MRKTTIFIIELCFVDELFHLKGAKRHFVKVNRESVTSEWVLNEGVTTARTCSFVETCEVCCSVVPKNNAIKGATFYQIPGMEICPG